MPPVSRPRNFAPLDTVAWRYQQSDLGDAWGPAARPRGYGPLPPPLPSRYLRGSGPGQRAVASGSVVLSRGCYVDRETAGLGGEAME